MFRHDHPVPDTLISTRQPRRKAATLRQIFAAAQSQNRAFAQYDQRRSAVNVLEAPACADGIHAAAADFRRTDWGLHLRKSLSASPLLSDLCCNYVG